MVIKKEIFFCDFCNKKIIFEDSCVIDISYTNMQTERVILCSEHEDRFASWLIRNGSSKWVKYKSPRKRK